MIMRTYYKAENAVFPHDIRDWLEAKEIIALVYGDMSVTNNSKAKQSVIISNL
jgi:hypothetical protein